MPPCRYDFWVVSYQPAVASLEAFAFIKIIFFSNLFIARLLTRKVLFVNCMHAGLFK